MNKGNCSSLVFIKFGKGRVCVSLLCFLWESGVGKSGKGKKRWGCMYMYVFIRVIM